MIRGDLSSRLVHLTKGETQQEASDRFLSIVKHGVLKGGAGDIRGGYLCVCFSEAPIGIISQVLAHAPIGGMRYAPFGVILSKTWLFQMGGRPVIYQANNEFENLPEAIRYRHVRYEPDRGIDFTWEREWRIRTDELKLDAATTTFLVPTRSWADKFRADHFASQQAIAVVMDDMAAYSIEKFPWHFLALEDLGVEVDWPAPP